MKHENILPQSINLENGVIGAVLLEKDAFYECSFLKPEHFYLESNKIIWEVICSKVRKGDAVDILTVSEAVKDKGVSVYELSDKIDRIASSAHIESHARIVYQRYAQRQCINLAAQMSVDAYSDQNDIFDLLNKSMQGIMNLTCVLEQQRSRSMPEIYDAVIREAAATKKDELTGVPAGFSVLDNHFNGWQDSDLIVIAARPGMGKTSLAAQLALNASRSHKTIIFSLEMSSIQLGSRLMSIETDIPIWRIKTGNLDQLDFNNMSSKIGGNENLMIDDSPRTTMIEIRSKCHRAVNNDGLDIVFIDYLQLISGDGDNYTRITNISRELKLLAKELNIPVIALSQLSREVEKRSDKKPQLSDLRESGAIEQDADVVNFLWMPHYYGITDEDGGSLEGKCKIINAKNRGGSLDDLNLYFVPEKTKFYDEKMQDVF